jgi:hypothetical protein
MELFMVLTPKSVTCIVFLAIVASLPSFAIRRGDTGSSQNGFLTNCPPSPQNGVCEVANNEGTATLTGTDMSGNPVTVTITLYDWGKYPCSQKSCQKNPVINHSVLDVVLTGSDTAGIESLVVKGVLPFPGYMSCDGQFGTPGIGCIYAPEPDGSDVQEPTPITAADNATNTRWDFGGLPPSDPPLPAVPFDQLLCSPDGFTGICEGSHLGEAVLQVTNSVAANHLTTDPNNYLVTLIDGTKLGGFTIPASPTKQVANTHNTQATATAINKTKYNEYTDSSEAYPQMNPDGSEQYPEGFVPLPLTNPPPCNPNYVGQIDNRTFRTAWYVYTAPSNGTINVNTQGSRYDTLIYVFTGSASQPTVTSCDDDPANKHTLQASTTFTATKGTTYNVMVGEIPPYPGYPLSVDGALYFRFQFKPAN